MRKTAGFKHYVCSSTTGRKRYPPLPTPLSKVDPWSAVVGENGPATSLENEVPHCGSGDGNHCPANEMDHCAKDCLSRAGQSLPIALHAEVLRNFICLDW